MSPESSIARFKYEVAHHWGVAHHWCLYPIPQIGWSSPQHCADEAGHNVRGYKRCSRLLGFKCPTSKIDIDAILEIQKCCTLILKPLYRPALSPSPDPTLLGIRLGEWAASRAGPYSRGVVRTLWLRELVCLSVPFGPLLCSAQLSSALLGDCLVL